MAIWVYKCEQCGWVYETSDPKQKKRLDRGKVPHSSIFVGDDQTCSGFLKRQWTDFTFNFKDGLKH